jgi:hypothetical protein
MKEPGAQGFRLLQALSVGRGWKLLNVSFISNTRPGRQNFASDAFKTTGRIDPVLAPLAQLSLAQRVLTYECKYQNADVRNATVPVEDIPLCAPAQPRRWTQRTIVQHQHAPLHSHNRLCCVRRPISTALPVCSRSSGTTPQAVGQYCHGPLYTSTLKCCSSASMCMCDPKARLLSARPCRPCS